MFDVIVIGAGHAGCEAALAASRLKCETLLLTLNLDAIALMPCNPSIGGTGKGHLVREVDALGGEMGNNIDATMLQSRMLNTGKGPAVHSLRAQADKHAYQKRMHRVLFSQEFLTVRQGEATEILVTNGRIIGICTTTGETIPARAVIVATGVYLKSRIIIGDKDWNAGPQGLLPANSLSKNLQDLGFALRRFKTGTPARVDVRSINFDKMEAQPGDDPVIPFSFLTDKQLRNTHKCYLTWTNDATHDIIRANINRSPMFSGAIKGTGARYCPSIEDKVYRFADKNRHQLFLEPESADSFEWYVQGMSSSMPEDVQHKMYHTVPGLEEAVLTRLAYAIEYDCIDPQSLSPSLAAHDFGGLFFAGQISGTSGYEEAAAQGILAGINAVQYISEKDQLILTRDMSYIGVMTDDLTGKGTDEPYRMMTSRAEHRLYLRQDNADIRLTPIGHSIGLASDERMQRLETKIRQTEQLIKLINDSDKQTALRRPEVTIEHLIDDSNAYAPAALRQAEIQIKYAGYLRKEEAHIRQAAAMENRLLPQDIPYMQIDALRIEARQKLAKLRPASLGQASRMPGVSPADVAVLTIWLKQSEKALMI
ncbi:MAG: tRNA uridine-5-carboxymethylaminomethyl(34) synthesis enzyme MnmG [Eubacteriales bacterium]|nr:tRNA uridine-5-carboxymethylaminomethyl(34) synthesis enzyme MnmG [Eubacteriales bacterium]MDD4105960.1 tRNA uridine-5-carboxymethylaminomethyl(34) synthesis enzyme MnmG [Eubacteriales bacterium]MDD4711228.1 tRNA uridine-5-carboxymethylaminomethyl(34) synthesis enzyme MnmG [Eubacteriales bacterium]NLO16234.1 tRNA uridine-5-carboxymethylaminomethyl(34) synthesis enzyme MnmG [Clostridiales bacterium]